MQSRAIGARTQEGWTSCDRGCSRAAVVDGMLVAIGSKNRAKVSGITAAMSAVWPGTEFTAVDVQSVVRAQPMSDDEGIAGAIGRARQAIGLVKGADFGVGAEGAVQENRYGMFVCGWVAVVDPNGTVGLGSSGRAMLPRRMASMLNEGMELGPIVKELAGDADNEIRHTIGTVGVLTKGLAKRTEEFEEATKMALAIFITPYYYGVGGARKR